MQTTIPWNAADPMRPLKWTGLLVLGRDDITLTDGMLAWQLRLDSYREIRPPKGLLLRFIGLHDKGARAFLRFAQNWGVLGLCEHGLPATHDPYCSMSQREPVERWRSLSVQARAILNLRDTLNRGGRPSASTSDWDLALSFAAHLGDAWAKTLTELTASGASGLYRGFHQNELSQCVQAWLDAARIGPRVTWNRQEKHYQITLKPSQFWRPNLFAHLAMELMLAVADVERLAICSGCGGAYTPSGKRPAECKRSFCVSCGRKASVRLAVRRFRERKRNPKRRAK